MSIHLARKAQLALLLTKKVTVPTKYLNFADVFLKKLANVLPKRTKVNEHAIELEEGKQPPYKLIYSLRPVELKTLKTYIKTNLANGFIRALKSPASSPILFVHKPNSSLCLSVNYRGLNNLIIKNWYFLPLIGKFLDRLSQTKQFTQLDFISVYYQIRIKEGNEWKTAFKIWYGHFKYQIMPFGLSNVPASFQGYINKILAKKLNIFVIVYYDDIFIYSKDPKQAHVAVVWWVLEELKKNHFLPNSKNAVSMKIKSAS